MSQILKIINKLKPRSGSVAKNIPDSAPTNQRWERPVKFTTSEANVGYKATTNFYSDQPNDRAPTDNYAIAGSLMAGIFYMFMLRDDINNDGGFAIIQPIHEIYPEIGIPLIEQAISQNRALGYSTVKLEAKLKDYKQETKKKLSSGEKYKYVDD